MIVSSSDFDGFYMLPLGANSNLNSFIEEFEPEIIRMVCGQELGQLVIDDDGVFAEQRYQYLVEGKTYTDESGIARKWFGLKTKIIVPYVYAKYLMSEDSMVMPVGTIVPGVENAERISNHSKIVYAWREMFKYYMPTMTGYYYVTSAYDYLSDNEDDYPEWEFTPIRNLTSLMI